jgi:arylsulfatase A-like enzyme/Flp pilus assembly protein TadD
MRLTVAAGIALLLGCRREPAAVVRPNVLVVTIDTLRADHVGTYGSAAGATPNLDIFARQAALFETAVTPAPLTLPAHTAIFSGILPFRSGVRVNGTDHVAEGVPLLAPDFSARGYDTAAFVSSLVLRKAAGLNRGFGLYDDDFSANAGKEPREFVSERKGEETVGRALAWLGARREKKDPRPYFLWVHLYDPHAPYEPPEPFASSFRGRAYDGEIAYADSCFAKLLKAIDLSKTVVAVAGDHGESLGEHGESGHGVFLYDATIRVPLLLRLPDSEGSGVHVKTQVRLTDVSPTLRAVAGLPPIESDGEDLRPLLAKPLSPDRPALSESDYPAFVLGWSPMRALRFAGEKFIDAPKREYYELHADPKELQNSILRSPQRASDLARRLVRITSEKPIAESTSSATDPETARRLASLGYISGGAAAIDYDRIDPSRVDPKDHIDIWSQIESGLIARQSKRYEGAVAIFERVLASYPTLNPVILRDYAQACRFSGRLDRAIELYEKILKTAKPESEDFFGLGVAWHLKKDERKACENFERAVALDSEDVSAWIDLGDGRLVLGDFERAAMAFSKAVALDPRSVDALSGLASAAFERKDYETAESSLRKALAAAPENAETKFNLAIVEKARGQTDSAREIYQSLLLSRDPRVQAKARQELAK